MNIASRFGLIVHDSRYADVRRLKRSFPTQLHGNKLWGSTYLLLDYLRDNPPPHNSRILEPGCGWGLPGIYCARQFDAVVTATDADANVLPYLQLHAELNGVAITSQQLNFESITEAQLGGFDWLIASDICFWDELVEPVYELIARACEAGVKKVVIADPLRPSFYAMAERCVESFYAELMPVEVFRPRKMQGCVMVIENY